MNTENSRPERLSLDDSSSETLLYGISKDDRRSASLTRAWLIQGLLFSANFVFLVYFAASSTRTCALPDYFSPAQSAIEYVPVRWELALGERSRYTMPPSPQVDAAWRAITADGDHGGLVVQKEDLDRAGKESISLGDGSGYLALVDVFHQLHCLDYLRRTIYNDTYYHMGVDVDPFPDAHVPHCIDIIRSSLQCNADISLVTFRWVDGYPKPWPDFENIHQCRKWDKIAAWAEKRKAPLETLLRHPTMGNLAEEPIPRADWFTLNNLRFVDGLYES